MEIIQCTSDNAQTLATIVSTSWYVAYGDILSPDMLEADSTKRHIELLGGFYANGLQNNWFEAFFIMETNTRIGSCIVGKSKDADAAFDVAEILGIYILNEYRYKGFGSQALTFIEDRLRRQNYKNVNLWILAGTRAITFYRRHGYKPDGTTRDAVLGNEIMEIRLSKTL